MIIIRSVFRILVQILIAGPIILYSPFAALFGVGAIFLAIRGEIHEAHKAIAFSLGWLGLIGLYSSILVPVTFFHRSRIARIFVITLLVCGFVTTGVILFGGEDPAFDHLRYFHVWYFGGPVFVALWNLGRILDRPNQSPEPTPGSVTPRATVSKLE